LASVVVKVFHATEAYSSLELTNLEYNIKRLSIVANEETVEWIRPNDFKACEDIVHTLMKISFE
jgi:hypothetical protein